MARTGRGFTQQAHRILPNRGGRYINVILRDKDSALIASTAMKVAILLYGSGTVTDPNWMVLDSKQVVSTDGSGLLRLSIDGAARVGDTVYIMVIESDSVPAQSMVWTTTVQ